MLILIILAGISSAAYLCETIDGGNFTQNGQWPDRPGQLKYPHLGGYWNIKAVDHTQVGFYLSWNLRVAHDDNSCSGNFT